MGDRMRAILPAHRWRPHSARDEILLLLRQAIAASGQWRRAKVHLMGRKGLKDG